MIRWIREKFKGNLDRKYRRLHAEIARVFFEQRRLTKREKKIRAQIMLIDILRGKKNETLFHK